MNPNKIRRELDEEVSIARVQSALEGDTSTVAAIDAMGGKAQQLTEAGKISALAYMLAGRLAADKANGLSEEESRAAFVRLHDGNPTMAEAWNRCVDELRRHGVHPYGGPPCAD